MQSKMSACFDVDIEINLNERHNFQAERSKCRVSLLDSKIFVGLSHFI